MKKLLNTLYIFSENSYLSLDGENIVIKREDENDARVPLHNLESIYVFNFMGLSPKLMSKCTDQNIGISFLNPYGRFQARVEGKVRGNVYLRREQYRIADDENRAMNYSRNFILGKIYNSKWIIERGIRDHSLRIDVDKAKDTSQKLTIHLKNIRNIESSDVLRGIEGNAAEVYFSSIDQLILNQKETFYFIDRNRRPPRDPFNAVLSYLYTLLTYDVASALETVGLDPYVGFMHVDRPGRPSLALDLMEELRAVMVDRLAISLVNLKIINEKGFEISDVGTVQMNEETRKTISKQWQEKKQEVVTHPFIKEKIQWGMVPFVQAQLLARTIRGDLEEYPPFLWK
ncbi:type I-C CRISPR-associated endonuclease Cas1 [Tissierella creatinini]|nr:type I-C CRISPR-associated endonuclease Cas1 [Tissierella creatinini]TJX64646.1 type I-C CRISPR-associated endonuclease Cas1 [Soehngenia saccharolytica]